MASGRTGPGTLVGGLEVGALAVARLVTYAAREKREHRLSYAGNRVEHQTETRVAEHAEGRVGGDNHIRVARGGVEDGQFAEVVARTELRERRAVALHLDFAVEQHEELVTRLARAQHLRPGRRVSNLATLSD